MPRGLRIFSIVCALALAAGVAWWATRPAGTASPGAIGDDAGPGLDDAESAAAPALHGRGTPESEAAAAARRTRVPSVAGVVRRAGRPIAAKVEAYLLGAAPEGTPVAWADPMGWIRRMDPVPATPPSETTRSGADGLYAFESLARGVYRLAAIAEDAARGTETVEVHLAAAKGGAPTSGGYVTSQETDALGRATIEGLDPAARYSFRVQPNRKDRVVGTQVLDVLPADFSVTLAPALTIAGHVRDLSGRPLGGVAVSSKGPVGRGGAWSSARSDADGAFELSDVAPGAHVLRAAWIGNSTMLALAEGPDVSANAGATDVTLTLDPGLPLVVRVEGAPRGREAGVVRLTAAGGAGPGDWRATLDASGVARFEHASADARYTLVVGPLPGRLCALVTDVRPGAQEVVVRLARGEPIRGRLVASAFSGSTQVTAEREGAYWFARVDGEGGFLFPALPPGRYRIHASTYVPARWGPGDDEERPAPVATLEGFLEAAAGSTIEIPLAPPK